MDEGFYDNEIKIPITLLTKPEKSLPHIQILLAGLIFKLAYASESGVTGAKNRELGKVLGVSATRIAQVLRSMAHNGLIFHKVDKTKTPNSRELAITRRSRYYNDFVQLYKED